MRNIYEAETGTRKLSAVNTKAIVLVAVGGAIFLSVFIMVTNGSGSVFPVFFIIASLVAVVSVFSKGSAVSYFSSAARLTKDGQNKDQNICAGRIVRIQDGPAGQISQANLIMRKLVFEYTPNGGAAPKRIITPWLLFTPYNAANYWVGRIVKVAYDKKGAVIIKTVKQVSGGGKETVLYDVSVLENAAIEKKEVNAAKKQTESQTEKDEAILAKKQSAKSLATVLSKIAPPAETETYEKAPFVSAPIVSAPEFNRTVADTVLPKGSASEGLSLRLLSVKDKYQTVEVLSSELSMSKYDIRAKIEANNLPIFKVSGDKSVEEIIAKLASVGSESERV